MRSSTAAWPERLEFDERDVQEAFFSRGWTDGLPVVAPTPELVSALLGQLGDPEPARLIGELPSRRLGVTVEQAAVNAVMAGCLPEFFPVVLAALEAMFDPAFNLHGVLTSTGGAALCAIVSGPLTRELGMNARHNVLGEGNRANATIGRALRLVALNALDAQPGVSDGSSIGNPGRYSLCFAEDPPPAPWTPLSVRAGFDQGDTTVTMVPVEGPHQLAQQLTHSAHDVLLSFAHSIRHPTWMATGKGGTGVLVLGPEHTGFCIADGLSIDDVREFVCRHARISPAELTATGVHLEQNSQHPMVPGEDGLLATFGDPEDLEIVTAGGEGAGWSAWLPTWAPLVHSRRVTRRVVRPGEAYPGDLSSRAATTTRS